MMGKNVNLPVIGSRCDDEARAGSQGIGETPAQGREALGARHVEVGDHALLFIDESGLSERPSVARTWSLRGRTPVLQHSFYWKQLSAIAGLCLETIGEVGQFARNRLKSMQRRPTPITAFLKQAELVL